MEIEVIRSNRKTIGVQITADKLIIKAPDKATNEDINMFLLKNKNRIDSYLREIQLKKEIQSKYHKLTSDEVHTLAEKASVIIPQRVAYYAPLIGVDYGKITIRNQKSKWGSCSSKGNLNFNCLLMLTPQEVIDSIVVHELCHRKEMNHSDKFYTEVLRVFPDYWKWDSWLKDNGDILMAMMGNTKTKEKIKVQVIVLGGWVFYISNEADKLDDHKSGKWMYYFSDKDYASKVCKEAVSILSL